VHVTKRAEYLADTRPTAQNALVFVGAKSAFDTPSTLYALLLCVSVFHPSRHSIHVSNALTEFLTRRFFRQVPIALCNIGLLLGLLAALGVF
jgi:hypothetical protein